MARSKPKYRRPLSDDQLEILELLYKFRFGSSSLVAEYFGKNHRAFAFNRLRILQEQGFIGKRFESTYRMQAKPAAYYLLPTGARKLQERRKSKDEINIKGIYKDKAVSETFIQHSLDIFSIYNQLKAQYGSKLDFFAKSDLVGYKHFPKPLPPDAFLILNMEGDEKHFFLDIFEDNQPFFKAVRKIRQYVEYRESGKWAATTDVDFPSILFVCDSTAIQVQIRKQIVKILSKSLIDDLVFATTTKAELKTLAENDAIWQLATKPDTKRLLPSIS